MDFFLIYLIGAIITFIWANNQVHGRDSFTVSLVAAAIWPLALIIKLILLSEKRR